MSIYWSRILVGRDDFELKPAKRDKGAVVPYPHNNLRLVTDDWPRGHISTADVPHYCVPGHSEECEDYDPRTGGPRAEWLRLTVENGAGTYLDVLVDVEAARRLGRDLTAWAKQPHVAASGHVVVTETHPQEKR